MGREQAGGDYRTNPSCLICQVGEGGATCILTDAHVRPRCQLTGALATACGDDAIRVFEEDPGSDLQQPTFSVTAHVPQAHSQDVNCVAWNPKERGLLASCSDDGELAFWKYQPSEGL